MNILFTPEAWEDYQWYISNDRANLRRVNQLIKDIQRSPFEGIGKPEPLKFNLSGFWSRRITGEHRLVYIVEDEIVKIVQCRFHY